MSEINENENRKTDLNDELDYEEEENQTLASNNANNNINKKQPVSAADDDSDGEIKSDNQDDLDEGEVPSPKKDKSNDENDQEEKPPTETKEDEKLSEEEGEINDGEKVKKAFIPRVLCKYYQRGKCTWGRTCKFLHPGVNDTGSYTFLEYQDPVASLHPQKTGENNFETDLSKQEIPSTEIPATESAWERGLRIAREMKEKALKRKQMEKDQFDDKKMNLSLKEFENEKENDERYVNVEMSANVDDDLDDEELNLFANSGRIRSVNNEKNSFKPDNSRLQNNRFESSFDPRSRSGGQNDQRTRQMGNRNITNRSPNRDTTKSRADEWHDPWERSRQTKKTNSSNRRDRSNSYSSSDSDSRSRSRSRSRSSNSSRSSYSYSSRSSRSRSPSSKKDKQNKAQANKSSTSKLAPGRQISEASLKKLSADSKGKRKSSKSRSDSSASSYSSSSDDDDSKSGSDSEIDSYSDEEEEKRKKSSGASQQARASMKASLKRAGEDLKNLIESKKSKSSTSPTSKQYNTAKVSDKKQMIKDQLKLLESALNKKKQMNK